MLIDGLKRWFSRGGGGGGSDDGAGADGGGRDMISCEEALTRLQEFVDGQLTDLSQEQVEAHFEVCTRCYPHLALETAFKERVHAALARAEVPADLRDRVEALLKRADEG